MPIVVKRIKKYFSNKDGSISPTIMEDPKSTDAELLRTIKLSKNVFKLSLPASNYAYSQNFATIPGTQVIKQAQTSSSKDLNVKRKNNLAVSNTKTSVITLSSNKLSNLDVNLPIISNKNRLASIDDDNNDDYEERVPTKPKIHKASSDEDESSLQRVYKSKISEGSQPPGRSNSVSTLSQSKGASGAELAQIQPRKQKVSPGNLLPQVSNSSRKSLEEGADEVYLNSHVDGGRINNSNQRASALSQSPSLNSLPEQSIIKSGQRKSSKDSNPRDKNGSITRLRALARPMPQVSTVVFYLVKHRDRTATNFESDFLLTMFFLLRHRGKFWT